MMIVVIVVIIYRFFICSERACRRNNKKISARRKRPHLLSFFRHMSRQQHRCRFYLPTLLAGGLVVSYISSGLCRKTVCAYQSALSGASRETFSQQVVIRSKIFMQGLGLGLIIALLHCEIAHSLGSLTAGSLVAWSDFLVLLLGVPILYYTITPKAISILAPGTSAETVRKWFQVYHCFQLHMAKGFVAGVLLTMIATWLLKL